jgi:fumarate hydratase class II
VANGGTSVGLGINTGTSFTAIASASSPSVLTFASNVPYFLASTGFTTVVAVEAGDGVNANKFDTTASNTLFGNVWL